MSELAAGLIAPVAVIAAIDLAVYLFRQTFSGL